jgi:hypothetical protein
MCSFPLDPEPLLVALEELVVMRGLAVSLEELEETNALSMGIR